MGRRFIMWLCRMFYLGCAAETSALLPSSDNEGIGPPISLIVEYSGRTNSSLIGSPSRLVYYKHWRLWHCE